VLKEGEDLVKEAVSLAEKLRQWMTESYERYLIVLLAGESRTQSLLLMAGLIVIYATKILLLITA